MCLDIAIPIGGRSVASDRYGFVRLRVVVDRFDHRLMDGTRFTPNMRDHQKAMPQQPAQVPAIEIAWQYEYPFEQPSVWVAASL